jgi:TonB family protein
MGIRKNQSLWTSVILHVALFLGLFLATIVEVFLPKEKPHIFEMVSEPSPQNATMGPAAPIESLPDLTIPEIAPMDIPDPVMPEPTPTPPKQSPVTPPKPAPVVPKPAPEPTPEPTKLITLDDFRKKNPLKEPKPVRVQTPKPAYVPPKIDTSRIQENLQHNLPTTVYQPSGSLTSAERSALQRYGDQLNGRLNRAWLKPDNLAGVRLVVTVVFDVSSSGRISNIRLSPSSGNASFDASVKAAFARVGSGGVTPTGQGHSFTMSFKMVD